MRMTSEATETTTRDTGQRSGCKNWSPLNNKPEKRMKLHLSHTTEEYTVHHTNLLGHWNVKFALVVLSGRPVWFPSRSTDVGPACSEPGPAGAAPGHGCSAAGQSGIPGGEASGRAEGWLVSAFGHEDRQKTYSGGDQAQEAFYISHWLHEFVKSGGLLLTIWATFILFIFRGGRENRPLTARISDTLGFSPRCTWKCTESRSIPPIYLNQTISHRLTQSAVERQFYTVQEQIINASLN